jgi:hypothetical protein
VCRDEGCVRAQFADAAVTGDWAIPTSGKASFQRQLTQPQPRSPPEPYQVHLPQVQHGRQPEQAEVLLKARAEAQPWQRALQHPDAVVSAHGLERQQRHLQARLMPDQRLDRLVAEWAT